MQKIDFTSINTIIQLLALLLALLGFYVYKVIKDRNKTLVDLHKLANKNEIGQLIEKGKSEVFIPENLSRNQQFEIVKEQVRQKHNQYILRISVVIILIVLFFLTIILLIFFPLKSKVDNSKFNSIKFSTTVPVVIGIYPNNIFGPDQKKGLHLGIDNSGLNIKVIDLDFLTIEEMKTGKVKKLIDTLAILLKNQNVLSIVGPSITECSGDILQLLKSLKSKVPIFITSAASRNFLKWDQLSKDLNLFRTGSGIDKRADLIANFLKEKKITRKSLFLIEDNITKNTFGRMYYQELTGKSEILTNAVKNNDIDTFYYESNNFQKLNYYLKEKLSTYDFVFVLGVGKTFRQIIDTFYNPQVSKIKLPWIGGWMNGYALNSEIDKKDFMIYDKKVFEITDLDLSRARNYDATPDDNLKAFSSAVGTIHVGVRDLAISYDAAICLTETYKLIYKYLDKSLNSTFMILDSKTLNIFAEEMRNGSFEGILSKIIFLDKGIDRGINDNIKLDCAIFDSSRNNWVRRDIQELLTL